MKVFVKDKTSTADLYRIRTILHYNPPTMLKKNALDRYTEIDKLVTCLFNLEVLSEDGEVIFADLGTEKVFKLKGEKLFEGNNLTELKLFESESSEEFDKKLKEVFSFIDNITYYSKFFEKGYDKRENIKKELQELRDSFGTRL